MTDDFYANIGNYEIEQYNKEYTERQKQLYGKELAKIRRLNPTMTNEEYERQIIITRRQFNF